MSTYLKITLFVFIVFLIQLYGILVHNYNLPSFLNESWYIGSFWVSGALGVLGVILSIAIISTTDNDADKETTIKMFGFDELSPWIYSRPFLLLAIVFVQLGSLWVAVFCFSVWSYQTLQIGEHRDYLIEKLSKEAEKGTKNH